MAKLALYAPFRAVAEAFCLSGGPAGSVSAWQPNAGYHLQYHSRGKKLMVAHECKSLSRQSSFSPACVSRSGGELCCARQTPKR